MKILKLTILAAALAMTSLAAGAAEMNMTAQEHKAIVVKPAPTEAEVKKVYLEQGKITLKHGEIKNLDMPPMTMQFKVKDAALLKGIAAGDKVVFTAEMEKDEMVITSISKKKP